MLFYLYKQETLTGFKWMGNLSHSLLQDGHEVLFAFEEAIGFMFGTVVLDKDGISAGAAIAELGSFLYETDRNFSDLLEEIYLSYGRFISSNSYFICNSTDIISRLFDSLRKDRKVSDARFVTFYVPQLEPTWLTTEKNHSSKMICFFSIVDFLNWCCLCVLYYFGLSPSLPPSLSL